VVEEVHRAHDCLEEEDGLDPHFPVHEGDHDDADEGGAKEGAHLGRGGREGGTGSSKESLTVRSRWQRMKGQSQGGKGGRERGREGRWERRLEGDT